MQKLINTFLASITADGKSPCTVANYKSDLQSFANWLTTTNKSLAEIRYADLRNFADELVEKNLAASSRARKISAIKSFFRYLAKMEIIKQNPADGLTLPKQERKQPKVITSEQTKKLLEFSTRNKNSLFWFRDYTILATFLYTGIRREELVNIKLTDVNLQNKQILIHGKGAKQRFVFINPTLMAILSEYFSRYRRLIKTAKKSDYLFPTNQAVKMNVHTVNDIVNNAFVSVGIKEKGVSAHILRKRFATTVFQNTGDIATTSKMLGHSSPTVTMRYVVIDEQNMRNATNSINF